jgi:uncharacterized protein
MRFRFLKRVGLLRLARVAALTAVLSYIALLGFAWAFQSVLMYHPTHDGTPATLPEWRPNGVYAGLVREGAGETVWLVLHGNKGESSRFVFIANHLPARDKVYFLEYPGFGRRPGRPSMESLNTAAEQAVADIRAENPRCRLSVIGVSLGTGPAAHLGPIENAPERIVLVVPFRDMAEESQYKYPMLPAKWLVRDNWDNAAALKNYRGRLDIYADTDDRMIPVSHARALKADLPRAGYVELPGGHNDWSKSIGVLSD